MGKTHRKKRSAPQVWFFRLPDEVRNDMRIAFAEEFSQARNKKALYERLSKRLYADEEKFIFNYFKLYFPHMKEVSDMYHMPEYRLQKRSAELQH